MLEKLPSVVKSPCIGVCAIDDVNGLCAGCYRTLDEIKSWWDLDSHAQNNLLIAVEMRQLQQINFDD